MALTCFESYYRLTPTNPGRVHECAHPLQRQKIDKGCFQYKNYKTSHCEASLTKKKKTFIKIINCFKTFNHKIKMITNRYMRG